MSLKSDANKIINCSIKSVKPDNAIKSEIGKMDLTGNIHIIAIGKASWQMAKTTQSILKHKVIGGIVITKYGHSKGEIGKLEIFEAGHPVPDENTYLATNKVIDYVSNLSKDDVILFLISGGGSALFESSLISKEETASITNQLLRCGANIVEINTIRKRISKVKGGKFASLCAPAKIINIILSDVLGDPLDMIASGPTYADSTTCADALKIIEKYNIKLSQKAYECISNETPKQLDNIKSYVVGNVEKLCSTAVDILEKLGYKTKLLSTSLQGLAKNAGNKLADLAIENQHTKQPLAFVYGGETIVEVVGNGKGGRNQELALSAAKKIAGIKNVALFSVGSDGTDGPTDAAGGFIDGNTFKTLQKLGVSVDEYLANNDSYSALEKCGGLIKTGPTGTNVNDLTVLLIK